jgi:hypothetical protein
MAEQHTRGTYKCRLVARGFTQQKDINYGETYSPTTSFKSITALLHEAAVKDYEICTLDVGNAFLEAEVDYKIKMSAPKGFWELFGLPEEYFELQQALYGLKQSGRLWYQKLVSILTTRAEYLRPLCLYHERGRGCP